MIIRKIPGDNNLRDHLHPEKGFRDYIAVLLRGKRIILLSVIVFLAAAAAFTFLTEPIYEATAVVLVDTKGQQSDIKLFDITGIGALKNIKNELEILKSRSLGEAVARRLLELEYLDEPARERIQIIKPPEGGERPDTGSLITHITKQLQKTVDFDPVRDSDVIKITVKSPHAVEAALIANTLAQTYYDRNMFTSRMQSRAVREFLEDQLIMKKSTLDTAEFRLQKYMEQKGIVALDEESRILIGQISQLEAQRDMTDLNIESLTKTISSYKEQMAHEKPNVAKAIMEANDPYIRLLQENIVKLEIQRDVVVAQNPKLIGQAIYSEKLKDIEDQIHSLNAKLQDRIEKYLETLLPGQRIPGQSVDGIGFLSEVKQKIIESRIELQALKSRKKVLGEVIVQYEGKYDSIPQLHIQYAGLERLRLSNEKLYLLVEEKFNEAAIKEKSEFGYIEIIDPAVVPFKPVSPNIPLNVTLGGFLGLIGGIGFIFFRDYLEIRIRTPEDLEKNGYVTLSTITLMDEELKMLQGRPDRDQGKTALDGHLITHINPLSPISESYRRLRIKLQYAQVDRPVQAILITSPNPGEGKSTTVSNLAVTFAQSGKRVVLIDTDLRRPNLHHRFGMNNHAGLTDLLIDNYPMSATVKKFSIENLDILCCGTIPPNPVETLGSQRMKSLIEEFRKKYDIILLDSPPALSVTDSAVLSTLVDGVIIVVSSNHTRIESVDRTVELIQSVRGSCLGVVLNNFDLRKDHGGQYGYSGYKYDGSYYQYSDGGNGSKNGGRKKKLKAGIEQ